MRHNAVFTLSRALVTKERMWSSSSTGNDYNINWGWPINIFENFFDITLLHFKQKELDKRRNYTSHARVRSRADCKCRLWAVILLWFSMNQPIPMQAWILLYCNLSIGATQILPNTGHTSHSYCPIVQPIYESLYHQNLLFRLSARKIKH